MKKILITTSLLIILILITWKVFDFNSDEQIFSAGLYDSDINYISNTNSSADRYIATLKEQIIESPGNSNLLTKLGAAYIQKARETYDPEYYSMAEDVLNRSIEIQPDNFLSLAELGSVKLSRHHFIEALELSQKALQINPYSAYSYGVMVDAQVELGMYDEAVVNLQKMVDLRPDLSSYSRISYLRELFGDTDGAIDAMKSAITAGSPESENTVWCRVQLANLYFRSGIFDSASFIYKNVISEFPEYPHGYGGMAMIKMHERNYNDAILLYSRALEKNSLAEYLIALGDAYSLNGEKEKAEEEYRKVKLLTTIFKQKGIDTDLEIVLFNADHNRSLEESFENTKEALDNGSKNIKTYHSLAWTAFKLGNYETADQNIQQALRLGTKDPLLFYHAGKIFESTGDTAKAKDYLDFALKINPYYNELY
ncbi:MAG: tetratricopeptide repeat protein [Ignavibacteria bacterium]|nr:tetratricopeptide repeat protein [Ignavibacteria bacterium]